MLLINVDISYSTPRKRSPDRGNSLVGDPLIEICRQEPDSRATQPYEWDSALLYKTADESFRTGQPLSGVTNV